MENRSPSGRQLVSANQALPTENRVSYNSNSHSNSDNNNINNNNMNNLEYNSSNNTYSNNSSNQYNSTGNLASPAVISNNNTNSSNNNNSNTIENSPSAATKSGVFQSPIQASPTNTTIGSSLPPLHYNDNYDSPMHTTTTTVLEGSTALSNKLLHEAFAFLSLQDKCALSLSMSQKASINDTSTVGSTRTSTTTTPRVSKLGLNLGSTVPSPLDLSTGITTSINMNTTNTPIAGISTSITSSMGNPINISSSSTNPNYHPNNTTTSSIVDDMSEMQSVLSETDKESLGVAMSMMGHLELRQVEDEVRLLLYYTVYCIWYSIYYYVHYNIYTY